MPRSAPPVPPPADVRFPSIEGLRAFESVARLGSFEKAAEELSVTASAVSKRLGALEELLGTKLLMRSGKAITLSAAGKEYLEQVRAALGLLASVPLHQRTSRRMERLRVTTPPTFARQILVPQLESFTSAHPEVDLEVVLSIPYLEVAATEADIEVRFGPPEAFGAEALMQEPVFPVASPAFLARHPGLRRPQDLRSVTLLRCPLEPWHPWFQAAGLDWGEPAQGPKLVDLGMILEAAVSGLGVGLARSSLARGWLDSGALQPLFNVSAKPAWQYFALTINPSDSAQSFVEWLAQVCRGLARSDATGASSTEH